MGQRHQLFLIARIHGHYRVLAGFHCQWLYGGFALQAAVRVLKALRNPFNARAIASEISTIPVRSFDIFSDKDTLASDRVTTDNKPARIHAPYTVGVLMSAFRMKLATQPGQRGNLLGLSILDRETSPSNYDNNDGITVFDLTDPVDPQYCFASLTGLEGDESAIQHRYPLTAEQYLRCYQTDYNEEQEIAVEVKYLLAIPLVKLRSLAETWPGDFNFTHTIDADEIDTAQDTRPSEALLSPKVVPSLASLSIATMVRELATSAELETLAVDSLPQQMTNTERLQALRQELLRGGFNSPSHHRLLGALISMEANDTLDLRSWMTEGVSPAEVLEILRAVSPQTAVTIDVSGCRGVNVDFLRDLVNCVPNVERILAFNCVSLTHSTEPLPISSLLTTSILERSLTTELINDDNSVIGDTVCWVEDADPLPSLTIFAYLHSFGRGNRDRLARRYGLELPQFSARGVLDALEYIIRVFSVSSERDFSMYGPQFALRAAFQSLGQNPGADTSIHSHASVDLGCLPSNLSSRPGMRRTTPEERFNKQEESYIGTDWGRFDIRADAAVPPIPRTPGWALVWDTRAMLPQYYPLGVSPRGQRSRLQDNAGDASLFANRYAFVRWGFSDSGAAGEVEGKPALVAIEAVSAREWVTRLLRGHGLISEAELERFDATMRELAVVEMTLAELPFAYSWPQEIWEGLDRARAAPSREAMG